MSIAVPTPLLHGTVASLLLPLGVSLSCFGRTATYLVLLSLHTKLSPTQATPGFLEWALSEAHSRRRPTEPRAARRACCLGEKVGLKSPGPPRYSEEDWEETTNCEKREDFPEQQSNKHRTVHRSGLKPPHRKLEPERRARASGYASIFDTHISSDTYLHKLQLTGLKLL